MGLLKVSKLDNQIHPTAIIDPGAVLGQGNFIGPYCIIGPNVHVGDGNRFEAFCSVGTAAEHRDYFHGPIGPVEIGNNNVFREFVSVQGGTEYVTVIGSDCQFLTGSYIAHDCLIEDRVTLSGHSKMGGKVYVCEGVNLGLGCDVHQYTVLGAYAMLGMGCGVTKTSQIRPCRVYVGIPAREFKMNQIAIDRNALGPDKIQQFEIKYQHLSALPINERLRKIK